MFVAATSAAAIPAVAGGDLRDVPRAGHLADRQRQRLGAAGLPRGQDHPPAQQLLHCLARRHRPADRYVITSLGSLLQPDSLLL